MFLLWYPPEVFPNPYIIRCTYVGYKATYSKASSNYLELFSTNMYKLATTVSMVVTVCYKYFAVVLLYFCYSLLPTYSIIWENIKGIPRYASACHVGLHYLRSQIQDDSLNMSF